MDRDSRIRAIAAALLFSVPGAAAAQAPAPLSFVQPLTPAATAAVQERLREAGVYTGARDGVWGPESQAALDRFQAARGLAVTGSINLVTAQALGLSMPRVFPPPDSVAAPAAAPLSTRAVRNVQTRLRALGFYRGAADGIWGPGTQAALERFQRGRGIEATGQINPVTVQALGLNPGNLEAALP
jgi:peptidoglycan hydrolase-like protein with peptidoglycan-binding domain